MFIVRKCVQAGLMCFIMHLYKHSSRWQDVHLGSYYILYRLVNDVQISISLQPIISVGEQPIYHNCASLCSLCEVKEGQRQFTYHLFSWITVIETNMLLVIFLGLIAKFVLVSGNCELETQNVKDFDWNKVSINILTYYNKPLLKLLFGFLFHLWLHCLTYNRAYQT